MPQNNEVYRVVLMWSINWLKKWRETFRQSQSNCKIAFDTRLKTSLNSDGGLEADLNKHRFWQFYFFVFS